MSDTLWPPSLTWPATPLGDGVVCLGQTTVDDVPRIVEACRDASSQRWLPLPDPYGESDARSFVASRPEAASRGEELTFAVRGADDPLLAGAMGLTLRGRRNEGEIGYWTCPDRRGRGWTARAVVLVARYAFAAFPIRRIEILVAVGNDASCRVAEAAGAALEGLRRDGLPNSDGEDAHQYSLLPVDVGEAP